MCDDIPESRARRAGALTAAQPALPARVGGSSGQPRGDQAPEERSAKVNLVTAHHAVQLTVLRNRPFSL